MKNQATLTFILSALLVATNAFAKAPTKPAAKAVAKADVKTAAAPSRTPASDPKRLLALEVGDYSVTNARPAGPRDKVCDKDAIHPIAWEGTADEPTLALGEATMFMDINAGMKLDADADYGDGCSFSKNTQVDARKLTMDVVATCKSESSVSHTELRTSGNSIDFVTTKKITKAGKTREFRSSCTLKKI